MQHRPAIVAVGRTRFGEHYGKEPEKLIEAAWLEASKACELERKDLEACYLSDCFLPITNKLGLEEGFLSELTDLHIPMEVTRTVSAALAAASQAVRAGVYETVLVGGIEKMTDRWDKIRDDLMLLEDPWSYYAGATPETNHELMLRGYIKKYGVKGENLDVLLTALAEVSVKNHSHALLNQNAQYQRKITVEQVLNARKAARKPLGIFDFAPVSDGASALIVTSEERARKLVDKPVFVLGCSSATDFLNFPSRADLTHFIATKIAMKNALKAARLTPWDLQIFELYDQSTVMEMVSLEDLGFCEEGTAWKSIHESCQNYKGYYTINGKQLFTNLNGGLKADGNPIGATGGAQIFEIFKQLCGEAGDRQVTSNGFPKNGGLLELEGFGTNGHVCILGRE